MQEAWHRQIFLNGSGTGVKCMVGVTQVRCTSEWCRVGVTQLEVQGGSDTGEGCRVGVTQVRVVGWE